MAARARSRGIGGYRMHRVFRLGRSVAAFSIVMVVAAACVSSGSTSNNNNGNGNGNASCSSPIKIGLLAPFSGIAASVGRNMGEGIKIAVDELNANGGVQGCQVEVVQRDDEFDPSKDAQGARELIDQEHVS